MSFGPHRALALTARLSFLEALIKGVEAVVQGCVEGARQAAAEPQADPAVYQRKRDLAQELMRLQSAWLATLERPLHLAGDPVVPLADDGGLVGHLVAALRPGGVLIYETFMAGNEAYGKPSNPDFLLRPGELRTLAAAAGLREIAFAEGYADDPQPAMRQAICAVRD